MRMEFVRGANAKNIKFFSSHLVSYSKWYKIELNNLQEFIRRRKKFVGKKKSIWTRKKIIVLLFRNEAACKTVRMTSERGARLIDNVSIVETKSDPKIHPNIRRGIFLSCKPLRSIFTSATECFTPLPLLTAPIFYILAPFLHISCLTPLWNSSNSWKKENSAISLLDCGLVYANRSRMEEKRENGM